MTSLKETVRNSRHVMLYGALMACLVFILKWLQWKYIVTDHSLEIYVGLIAVFFTFLGVWVATQLVKPKIKTVVVEKEVHTILSPDVPLNQTELQRLNLTTREYEVLQLLTYGHTNAEIADKLFLSLSTVKTHVSNLLVKMDVKNRTQALEKSIRLKIVSHNVNTKV